MHVWQNAKFLFPGLSAACRIHIGWEIKVFHVVWDVWPLAGSNVLSHCTDGIRLQSKAAVPIQSLEIVPSPCCLPNPGEKSQAGFNSRRSVLRRGWMRWVTFHLHCCPWSFPGWGLRMKFRHIRRSEESFQHHGWFYLLCRGDAGC